MLAGQGVLQMDEYYTGFYLALKKAGFTVTITPERKISVVCSYWLDESPRVSSFSFGDSFTDAQILTDRDTFGYLLNLTGAHTVTRWEFSK